MRYYYAFASLLFTLFTPNMAAMGRHEGLTITSPPPLGRAPRTCPAGPTLRYIDRDIGVGIGSFPLWAVGFSGPHAHLDYTNYPQPLGYHLGAGWAHKFLLVSKVSYGHHVTLHGAGLHGGPPLTFEDRGQGALARTLVLDPGRPWTGPDTLGSQTWAYFPGTIFVPRAGCYYLEARWPGGRWRISFAAGR